MTNKVLTKAEVIIALAEGKKSFGIGKITQSPKEQVLCKLLMAF